MLKKTTNKNLKRVSFNFLLLTAYCLLFFIHFSLFTDNCYSQGAAINTTGSPANGSAILDVSSTNAGILIPRMTTAERNSISNPADGLQIYNTTNKCFEFFNSYSWKVLSCGCDLPASPVAGTNNPTDTQIEWNWSVVANVTGYKYNTTNDYYSAIDNGTSTSYLQTGLACNTSYTLYVWAYNSCGSSAVTTLNQSTSACFSCGVDNITDSRDNNVYSTVLIGSQCWIKENLRYLPSVVGSGTGSTTTPYYYVFGYEGTDVNTAKSQANYNTFGVLYNWPAAMAGASGSNNNPSGVQGACPSGWHLPGDEEWKQMEMSLGMTQAQADATSWRGTDEGSKLKSTSGWYAGGNGSNTSNFTALPGGYRDSSGNFFELSIYGIWWSSAVDGSSVWRRYLYYSTNLVNRDVVSKNYGYSVRCVRD